MTRNSLITFHANLHPLLLLLMISCVLVGASGVTSAATTEIRVVKYAADEFTILTEKTVDYRWMEKNLRVYGDGFTHYYHQGPVFVDDPDPVKEEELRWNPDEDTNVQEKDMGAVKGTSVKDLCDLVGGMGSEDRVKIRSADGWSMLFAYKNVYEYSSREGPIVICWSKNGMFPDTGYSDGMRMVWFADTSTNPWGIHAFGNYDWHEAADSEYWYFYHSGDERYPTTTGLSGQIVSEILIYSQEEPAGSIEVTSTPAGAEIVLDGEETGEITPFTLVDIPAGSHTVSVQKDGYLDPIEEWVDVSHGVVVPVHFNLEREYSVTSSSGDLASTQDGGYVSEQISFGLVATAITGNISLHVAPGERQICRSGQSITYRIPPDSLPPSSFAWARLYLFSDAGYTHEQRIEVGINGMSPGTPERSTFRLPDGKVTETLAFNVTRMLRTDAPMEISARNPPGGNEWTLYPPLLLVVAGDDGDVHRENWISEGAGLVHAMKEYSYQDLPNLTVSDFPDIRTGLSGAELQAVSTIPDDGGASSPMAFQNSVVIPGEYAHNHAGIWVSRYNVTGTVSEYTHNELFWKTTPGRDPAVIGPRIVILTVSYPPGLSTTDYTSKNRSAIGPIDTLSPVSESPPPSPSTSAVTTITPDLIGNGREEAIRDDSFFSRIWEVLFWLLGMPIPGHGDQGQAHVTGDSPKGDLPNVESPSHAPDSSSGYPLQVSTTPPGALVSIRGGSDVQISPATFVLPGGEYRLAAEMDGYLSCQTMVRLAGPQEITLVLTPEGGTDESLPGEAPERSRHGGLLIVTYPGDLELSVDNQQMERKSPLMLYGLKEGYHTVKATRPSASAGKGETLITRAWVYHDALAICELDFVVARLDRRIRITDPSGNSTAFTLNGIYPLLRTPVTLEVPGTGSYITLIGESTYTNIPIQDGLADGSELLLPTYNGNYHAISIESAPSGAEIFMDGARTGNTTPSLVRGLSEGTHLVMVSLPGHLPTHRVISIPRTQEEYIKGTVSFILETYPSGPLRVESVSAGAAIFIDGIATGEKTPFSFTGIPIGTHELTLRSGDTTRSRDIIVRPDNPNRYIVHLL